MALVTEKEGSTFFFYYSKSSVDRPTFSIPFTLLWTQGESDSRLSNANAA